MRYQKLLMSLTVVAATLAPPAATANSLTFQGVTFEMLASDNVLTLNIYDALNAAGDWLGINSLAAFEVKSANTTNGTVTSTNTSRDWMYAAGGVNNGGSVDCGGGDSASSCFNAMSGGALDPAPLSGSSPTSDPMSWTIQYGAPVNLSAPSLKVLFLDSSGEKQGSLLSMTIPASPVPEPEVYAMIGIGLALLGWVGRRKRMSAQGTAA